MGETVPYSQNSGQRNIFVVSLVLIRCHSCTTPLSLYKRSLLYCFIKLKSLPNFVCSFIFDGLTPKVADISAVFL